MSNVTSIKQQVMNSIYSKVKLSAIGNSKRKMMDVAIDCINERISRGHDIKDIAGDCYLGQKTISNLIEGITMNPQSETLERIFRACEMSMTLEHGMIKNKYLNQPKDI